jgi:hypothetical protein
MYQDQNNRDMDGGDCAEWTDEFSGMVIDAAAAPAGALYRPCAFLLALYHLRLLGRLRYRLEGRPAPIGVIDAAPVVALMWLWA